MSNVRCTHTLALVTYTSLWTSGGGPRPRDGLGLHKNIRRVEVRWRNYTPGKKMPDEADGRGPPSPGERDVGTPMWTDTPGVVKSGRQCGSTLSPPVWFLSTGKLLLDCGRGVIRELEIGPSRHTLSAYGRHTMPIYQISKEWFTPRTRC